MHIEGEAPTGAPMPWVLAVLHDVEGWARWVPGLARVVRGETVYEGGSERPVRVEVEGTLRTPRDLRVRVAVDLQADGLMLTLVEGDVSALTGELTVRPDADLATGCVVGWSIRVAIPFPLPGALERELEREVLPRWVAAITGAAGGASG